MTHSHNTLFNLGGAVLPLAVTLVTIPAYLHLIGDARFGALAIVWVLLSYFGLFDLGLGRAASKYIAELSRGSGDERESLFWTVTAINAALGAVGAMVFLAAGSFLLGLFRIPAGLRNEVLSSVPWLAAALPMLTLISVFVGILEGLERFFIVNAWQVVADWVFRIAPLAIAYLHGPDLQWLIAASVLSRTLVVVPFFMACCKHLPVRHARAVERRWMKKLFSYGSWITVSGIVNPILLSLDRLMIGMTSGTASLAYYAVPFSFASKFLILPTSICRTLFPASRLEDAPTARELAYSATTLTAAITTPIAVVAIFLIRPFFNLWLGPRIAAASAPLGEIMLFGAWIFGLLHVPSTYLQGRGRPDLTAKLHLLEVVPYVGMLYVGLRWIGPMGAAGAWSLRVTAHLVLLVIAARLGVKMMSALVVPTAIVAGSVATVAGLPHATLLRFGLLGVTFVASLVWAITNLPLPTRTWAAQAFFRRSALPKVPSGAMSD